MSEEPPVDLWAGMVLRWEQGAPCNLRLQSLEVPDGFYSTWHLSSPIWLVGVDGEHSPITTQPFFPSSPK